MNTVIDSLIKTHGGHSNAVNAMGTLLHFSEDGVHVLCDTPGLSKIFGCPAVVVGCQKRPYSEAEIAHQTRYNGGKPYGWEDILWVCYKVDWSGVSGKGIPGTDLVEVRCVSSNSLSDATISLIAVSRQKGVVSILKTSYWRSDRNDAPEWRKRLFQEFGAALTVG
jgi:hypothetical protein